MEKFEYKKLSDIILEKNDKSLSYSDLLSTIEWNNFRKEIIKRDNYQCIKCGERTNELAWWLKGSGPFDIYSRPADEFEKKHLGENIIYSSIHVILNVHHKYYIEKKYPWEYKSDALITVCSQCHKKIHETEDILIYENEDLKKSMVVEKCNKCLGTGYLDEYHYYKSGICFSCSGKGRIE